MPLRHFALRPLALGAMLAALPLGAQAQVSLGPPPAAPVQSQPAPASRGNLPTEVESNELRSLDVWTVGVLTANQGGLPRNMWASADPAALAQAFDHLPSVYESPTVQNLARRVLLSGADAPPGDASDAARQRYESLGRMGAADELSQMAAGAGGALNDPAIAQYAAQAELARGRRAEACARGRMAQGDPPATFILRLRAYCAAATGDRAAADLALEIARSNRGEDAWVTSTIGIIGGAPAARAPAARYDTSLNAALSLEAHLRPATNPLANASSLALLAIARNQDAPQPLRAQAAAACLRRGILSPADARTILSATPATVTTGLPAFATALRQVTAAQGAPAAATAIAGVLRTARAPADFSAAARLFKDDIASLTPPDGATALLFARAAIASGDAQLAQRLLEAARQGEAAQTALSPVEAALAVMRGVSNDANGMAVHRRMDGAATATARTTSRDLLLMGAAGFQFDGAAQAFVTANPPQGGVAADAAALAALSAAAERNAPGEAVLYAALAAGDGPARLDANSAIAIIRALRTAHLDGEARRMAVEAILAGGPAA